MDNSQIKRSLERLDNHKLRVIATWLRINYGTKNKTALLKVLYDHVEIAPERFETALELVRTGIKTVSSPDGGKTTVLDEEAVQKLIVAWTQSTINDLNDRKITELDNHLQLSLRKKLDTVDAKIEKAFALAEKARPLVIRKAGTKDKKVKGVLPKEFERIVQLASQRVHTMLVGPAGCGKTFIAAKVAESLSLKFSSISCSVGMSESQLAGWLLPTGAAGKFEYVSSQFVEMYESGGVFLLDELDSADPNTITFLNKALAGDYFFIPQRFKKPQVKRHPDFVCIAAANTFGNGADAMYVGRNQLDAATRDRFTAGMIFMDYSPEVEEAIVDGEVLVWGRHIRSKIKSNNIRRVMSTRTMIDYTKMKTAYQWDKDQWEQSYFADWTESEKRQVEQPVY